MAKSTNGRLADVLMRQTYNERIALAGLLRDHIADWMNDEVNAGSKPDVDAIAWWLNSVSDEFYEIDEGRSS